MKKILLFIFILFISKSYSQNEIIWDGKYQLQLSDFQSTATQIGKTNSISLLMPSTLTFAFAMSNIEFMFTKNFNSKVGNKFVRSNAAIIADNDINMERMLKMAQFNFDLSELYARKLRKKIFENKKTFTNSVTIMELANDVSKNATVEIGNMYKNTNNGENQIKLKQLNDQVLIEIAELSDFCQECKIKKIK